MKKLAILLSLILLMPLTASAFNTDDLLATIAMPLAVNAVANVNGVPQSRLADLVSTLNQANVPPTQFVEVIRYVPPALAPNTQSDFLQFVRDQVSQGNTGQTLVDAIVQQLRNNYNIQPQLALSAPPTTIVVQDNYIPDVVITRVTTLAPAYSTSNDLLSLIGLPLAVAAVSNLTGVSQDSLANLLATLNQANVPPVQEIQIIRYVPVALVIDNGQTFVQYVQQQVAQGITGPALVPVVVQELRTYYPQPAQVVVTAPATPTPQAVIVDQNFVPPVVVRRVEEVRAHPHGGPPGQIKKELGLQTGAEVVHGEKPGHGKEHGGPPPMMSSTPAPVVQQAPPAAQPVPAANPPGKDHGDQKGDQGKGKGKDKGHGKD
jgi:hypothetical protein